MKKTACLLVIALTLVVPPLCAQETHPELYLGINPIALGQLLGSNVGPVITAFGFISGAESGLSLYAGWEFAAAHSLEIRLSTDPTNPVLWETQVQVGYLWYPCETFLGWIAGPSLGFFLRNCFFPNILTGYWTFNHVPEMILGWRFWIDLVAVDLRLGWNACALTWSSLPHSQTAFDWIDFPFGLSFSAGVAIGL